MPTVDAIVCRKENNKHKDTKKAESEQASTSANEERENERDTDWKIEKDTENKLWPERYDMIRASTQQEVFILLNI